MSWPQGWLTSVLSTGLLWSPTVSGTAACLEPASPWVTVVSHTVTCLHLHLSARYIRLNKRMLSYTHITACDGHTNYFSDHFSLQTSSRLVAVYKQFMRPSIVEANDRQNKKCRSSLTDCHDKIHMKLCKCQRRWTGYADMSNESFHTMSHIVRAAHLTYEYDLSICTDICIVSCTQNIENLASSK